MTETVSTRAPLIAAALTGLLVWGAICVSAGIREAWDDSAYWRVGLPLFALTTIVLAWRWPRRTWAYALVLMLAQALPLVTSLRAELSLLPLGLALLLVLSVPLMLLGLVTGWLSRLVRRRRSAAAP